MKQYLSTLRMVFINKLMTVHYFKRHFDEARIEQSEIWGTCDYYFETNQDGEVLRQIEV